MTPKQTTRCITQPLDFPGFIFGLGVYLSLFLGFCPSIGHTTGTPSASAVSHSDTPKSDTPTSDAPNLNTPQIEVTKPAAPPLNEFCETSLKKIPSGAQMQKAASVCAAVKQLDKCVSREGKSIFHFERSGEKNRQRIIAFALIHGDETESATVAAAWMERLSQIQPRNTWRVIPIVNPDGWKSGTRTNATGVDINRNFPSKDWNDLAIKYWKEDAMGSARRFPGGEPASEPETQCVMAHIEDFKPDFVISIHTPLGLLDFDGPKIGSPKFSPLPWVSLGNYPGSLGRYMWLDRNVPVLTVELKQRKDSLRKLEEFDRLQDITGTVALQAEKQLRRPQSQTRPTSHDRHAENAL